jgi:hypothetical protein
MKNSKLSIFFDIGRKWVFTLALFLFVFAAASAVKVQALGNVTGYLWGGSEDKNIGGNYDVWPPDGNETGAGEIRMSGTIQDGSGNKYGVNIPDSGNLSGEAWSENLGYLSFNVADLGGCPNGDCRAWRDGNTLKGWARFMEFKINAAQAGGWGGWVSLSNSSAPKPYGVTIEGNTFKKCDPRSGSTLGCAWSGETPGTGGNIADGLGWIDFSQASISETCSINSSGPTLDYNNHCRELHADLVPKLVGKTVTFSETSSVISLSNNNTCSGAGPSATCQTDNNGQCNIWVKGEDFSQADHYEAVSISASCGLGSAQVYVKKRLNCTISCPHDFEITSGKTDSYDVSVGGDAGCALDRCSETSDLLDANSSGSSCQITAPSSARYGSADVTSVTNGGQNCPTNVYIKGPGWVETNP